MGWLWSSNPPDSPPSPQSSSTTPTKSQEPEHKPPTPSSAPPQTRDELADQELQKFLEEISNPPSTCNPSSLTPSSSNPTTASNASSTSTSTSIPPNPRSILQPSTSIAPAQLYPTSMSCRAAFDAAYHCQLPGGQFVHVYRYGELRNCSQQWSDFWFCMRTNRGYMSEEERGKRIKQFYWEKERRYREGPSSEDVWEMRGERLKGAFGGDLGAYERERGERGGGEEGE
ncbi:MAG: hypothetical protein MMC23_000400 [Stictis urceolatum]|nr:hypothetical protein [Stictis urceolata]